MVKPTLTVAAVQLTSGSDVADNLRRVVDWIRRAAQAGAELVALPENYGFLGSDADKLAQAQSVDDGPFIAPLRELARDLGVAILAGSIPEIGPDALHTYNTSVLIGRQGETLATYRKIHLFDVDLEGETTFRESDHVSPGDETVVAELDGWVIGLSVCYDLRFPEQYRKLSASGARLLTVPSAFTLHTGKDHWESLLRARAIENLCYVLAPGQFGRHSATRQSWGKSMVVDPWGTMLAVAAESEGFALGQLDAAAQDAMRRAIPSLGHRRL